MDAIIINDTAEYLVLDVKATPDLRCFTTDIGFAVLCVPDSIDGGSGFESAFHNGSGSWVREHIKHLFYITNSNC